MGILCKLGFKTNAPSNPKSTKWPSVVQVCVGVASQLHLPCVLSDTGTKRTLVSTKLCSSCGNSWYWSCSTVKNSRPPLPR